MAGHPVKLLGVLNRAGPGDHHPPVAAQAHTIYFDDRVFLPVTARDQQGLAIAHFHQVQGGLEDVLEEFLDRPVGERPDVVLDQAGQHLRFANRIKALQAQLRLAPADLQSHLAAAAEQPQDLQVQRIDLATQGFQGLIGHRDFSTFS